MSEDNRYLLEVSEAQARLISDALEFYSRIGIGQIEMVEERFRWHNEFKEHAEAREAGRTHLMVAKELLTGCPPNGSAGIHNPRVAEMNRRAYDIHQVIRNRLAWDRDPKGSFQVEFDEPRQISDTPLPTIQKVKTNVE